MAPEDLGFTNVLKLAVTARWSSQAGSRPRTELLFAKYSRDDEVEADIDVIDYVVHAGIHSRVAP